MIDLLAIGPHPDDVELAAGGTVALCVDRGHSVVLADLTRGERGTRGTPEERRREAQAAAALLGVKERACLELPDAGLDARDPEQVNRLVALLRAYRPRLVIALSDRDDHPDHVEAAGLVRRATYLAGLRRYPEAEVAPHRVSRILWAMGRRLFTPSLVVDVTAAYERKKAALAAYRSQFFRAPDDPLVTPLSDPGFLAQVEARDRTHGHLIGAMFGEPFGEDGPVPVRDPKALFAEVTP